MRPVSRTPRAMILSGWLLLRLGCYPPLIRLLAKTSYLDGHFPSFRMTITLPDTRTSIFAGTSILQRTVLSYFPGGCALTLATSSLRSHSLISDRTCKIGNQILIGSKSEIADSAQVVSSVLGERCIIGRGSVVRNSYLFDGVVVGPNCEIEYSIIGAGVQIKEMSRVERGCLIADKVTIGPGARLEPFQKLFKGCQDDHKEEEAEADEDDDDEADEEEDDDDHEEDESEEEEYSDYQEVEAGKRYLKTVCLIFMSCFRSGSHCARKTWPGIQCDYMARTEDRRGRRYR